MNHKDSRNLRIIRIRLGWIIFWMLGYIFWPLIMWTGLFTTVVLLWEQVK